MSPRPVGHQVNDNSVPVLDQGDQKVNRGHERVFADFPGLTEDSPFLILCRLPLLPVPNLSTSEAQWKANEGTWRFSGDPKVVLSIISSGLSWCFQGLWYCHSDPSVPSKRMPLAISGGVCVCVCRMNRSWIEETRSWVFFPHRQLPWHLGRKQ